MYRLILILTVFICLIVFITNFSYLVPDLPEASDNFRYYCAQCHGADGRGGGPNALFKGLPVDPRDLTSKKAMSALSDDEIIDIIRYGGKGPERSTVMPPFEKTIPDIEIAMLKDYLRELCDC